MPFAIGFFNMKTQVFIERSKSMYEILYSMWALRSSVTLYAEKAKKESVTHLA